MPVRRRNANPLSGRRRRIRLRRRPGVARGMRIRRNPVYSFVRTKQLTSINLQTASDTLGRITFQLDNLDNYTEFTNLFQQFRILGVKLTFVPYVTSNDANPIATTYVMPNIHTVIDHDDSGTPANLAEIMQFRNHRMTRLNRVHSRYIKPSILMSAYETALTSAYIPKWKQWVSTDDYTTPHYGLKYFIDQSSTALTIRVFAKFYFQCKDLK